MGICLIIKITLQQLSEVLIGSRLGDLVWSGAFSREK